jgi:hypothetical protein
MPTNAIPECALAKYLLAMFRAAIITHAISQRFSFYQIIGTLNAAGNPMNP